MRPQADWFSQETLSDAVTRIWEPHVHSFFRANLYYVVGRDADLMIDFGTGLRSLRGFLPNSPEKPVIALATHVHIDHVGSFHEFERRLGHAAEAEAFASMEDAATLANYFRDHSDPVAIAPSGGWRAEAYSIAPASLTDVLEEGSVVDLGDRSFKILHLPGHSPGSIGLLDEARGVLFSGDAIYEGGLVDDLPGCDRDIYRSTMSRLLDLDIDIAYGGHGDPMSPDQMRRIAAEYLSTDLPAADG